MVLSSDRHRLGTTSLLWKELVFRVTRGRTPERRKTDGGLPFHRQCVLVMEEDEGSLFVSPDSSSGIRLERKEQAAILTSEVLPLGSGLVFGLRLLRRKQTRRDALRLLCLMSLDALRCHCQTSPHRQTTANQNTETCIKCEVNPERESSRGHQQH